MGHLRFGHSCLFRISDFVLRIYRQVGTGYRLPATGYYSRAPQGDAVQEDVESVKRLLREVPPSLGRHANGPVRRPLGGPCCFPDAAWCPCRPRQVIALSILHVETPQLRPRSHWMNFTTEPRVICSKDTLENSIPLCSLRNKQYMAMDCL